MSDPFVADALAVVLLARAAVADPHLAHVCGCHSPAVEAFVEYVADHPDPRTLCAAVAIMASAQDPDPLVRRPTETLHRLLADMRRHEVLEEWQAGRTPGLMRKATAPRKNGRAAS